MNENIVTRENCREVIAWLRGGDATPDPVMEDRFIDVMSAMVLQRIGGEVQKEKTPSPSEEKPRGSKSHIVSLRGIIDEMRAEGEIDETYEELMGIVPKKAAIEEKPKEQEMEHSEFDSFTLARILRYMGNTKAHPLNMSQIQIILYISYGIWLASTGERLMAEHPQVWQFGPVFPRAYNKLRKDTESGKQDYDRMKSCNPAVIEFLDDQVQRFGWASAAVTSSPHTTAGTPWAKTRKNNPDKWGAAMEDDDISRWFSKRM